MPQRDSRRGPRSMSPGELKDFLHHQPSGALCVADSSGKLSALPGRVLRMSEAAAEAEVCIGSGGLQFEDGWPACLVVDVFDSYWTIRGAIAQGAVSRVSHLGANLKASVVLRLSRIRTFSFAGTDQD
jgi:hypothetical protein